MLNISLVVNVYMYSTTATSRLVGFILMTCLAFLRSLLISLCFFQKSYIICRVATWLIGRPLSLSSIRSRFTYCRNALLLSKFNSSASISIKSTSSNLLANSRVHIFANSWSFTELLFAWCCCGNCGVWIN